ELHGLMDCAVEIADHFRAQLAERLDVDTAIELLAQRPPYARNTADVTECIRMIAALRSLNQQAAARVAATEARCRRRKRKIARCNASSQAATARSRPQTREADCSNSSAAGSGAASRIDRAAETPAVLRAPTLRQKTRAAPLPSLRVPPRRDNARCRWRS